MRNRNRWFRRTFGIGRRQMAMFLDGGIDQFGRPLRRGMGAMGRNQGDKPGSGPAGNCICPSCGTKVKHMVNLPCNETECPKCGATMTRE